MWRKGGSAGAALWPSLPVHRLMPWAQDPASPGKTASQQELPSFKYGSFFFPFSSTSARALSLSFSPLLSLPTLSPLIPNVACVVLALGVARQCQGRVGVSPAVWPASVSRALCAWWRVFTCACACPERQQRAAPEGCGAFPPSFPSIFPQFSDLPPFPVPHPSS